MPLMNQTTGLARTAILSRTGAATSAMRSWRCSAMRFGASSPRTSEKNAMISVTTMNEITSATCGDT